MSGFRSLAAPDSPVASGTVRGRVAYMLGTNTVSVSGVGMSAASVGTLTARSVASTSTFTRAKRTGIVSASTGGSLASIRHAGATLLTGSGTLGGFRWLARFGCSDAATVAGARQFAGVTSATGAPSDVEPSTLTNCIGVGHGASDTNLFVYFGAGSAGTPIDLGASFPANTLSTDLYEFEIICPATGGAEYRLTRLNTGAYATGTLTSAQIPSSTTALSPCSLWRSNNATALAVGLDLVSVFVEIYGV